MTKTVDTNNFSSYNSSPYDIVDTDSDEFVDFDADFLMVSLDEEKAKGLRR